MDNQDNNQDRKIKELFQKDKLISKKVDDLFNNFLEEESIMNKEKSSNKISIWKRAVAIAACFVVIFGGANIYASTQGYGNVFFLIKYLVTGEKVEIVDKNALLSDRDLVISYEPIQLTESIKIQIRRLLIKDNKATLSVVVREDGASKEDTNVVPFKYVVKNGNNEIICEQESIKQLGIDNRDYCDELELNSLYERDSVLNLEIYRSDGQLLVKLLIDINNKTITVEGAEEAISSISEKDLKKFIGVVSTYPYTSAQEDNFMDDDNRVRTAFNILLNYKGKDANIIDAKQGYPVETVNKVLEECGYDKVSETFKSSLFTVVKQQGKSYFVKKNTRYDDIKSATCVEITNLSYSAGIYTVDYTYTSVSEDDTFNIAVSDLDLHTGSFIFKVNDNNEYSKYSIIQFVDIDYSAFDPMAPFAQDNENEENNSNTTQTNTTQSNTVNPNNNGQNASTNTTQPTTSNNQNTNNKIDNYASSLNWIADWSVGLKLQYPDIMTKTRVTDIYRGSDVEKADQVATTFEGDLVGKDPDTQKKITSHTKITVYLPECAENMSEIDYYAKSSELILKDKIDFSTIPGGPAGLTSNKGINWSVHSIQKDGKYYELYTSYQSDVQFGYKVLFETDNIENYKVRNVINWFLGQIEYTSF